MMDVKVVSPQSVEVDGSNYGNLADAIANNPQLAASIQIALSEWYAELERQHQQTVSDLQGQIVGEESLKSENDSLKQQLQSVQSELEAIRNPPKPEQNYQGFYDGLMGEGLELFQFVGSLAETSLPVNKAYTDLMGAIILQRLEGFKASIFNLLKAVNDNNSTFNREQVLTLQVLLDKNGFSIELPSFQ